MTAAQRGAMERTTILSYSALCSFWSIVLVTMNSFNRGFQTFNRRSGKNPVSTGGIYVLGSLFIKHIDATGQSTSSIDHIINDNSCFAADISQKIHSYCHVWFWSSLVDNRYRRAKLIGKFAGPNGSAMVRRHDNNIFRIEIFFFRK